MPRKCEVLVITPPRPAALTNIITNIHPSLTQGIDSVPLRLAAVLERQFITGYLPLYHLQYNYYTLDVETIRRYLQEYRPRIVILANDYFISNRTTACFPAALSIAKLCKEELPGVRTIFVGKHAIVRPLDAFSSKEPIVDMVITGEPEDFILDLVTAVLSSTNEELRDFPGIYYRHNGEIHRSKDSLYPPDINKLPPPAYHLLRPLLPELLEREKPYGTTLPLTLRTSYGCLYQCPYCAGLPYWSQYRTRNAEGVAADVDAASNALGNAAELIFLDDELFTFQEQHVEAVANVFGQRGLKLEGVLTHVRFFNTVVAATMARFCRSVIFGAENFNDKVLTSLGKGQSRAALLSACQIAKEAGLSTRLEYIVGLPSETPETIAENLNFIYNALAQGWVDQVIPYVLTPHPGTAYGEKPEAYGLTIAHWSYEEFIEEGGYPVLRTTQLTREQIYVYYLLVRQVCYMASNNRRFAATKGVEIPVATYSQDLFQRLFKQIGERGSIL